MDKPGKLILPSKIYEEYLWTSDILSKDASLY